MPFLPLWGMARERLRLPSPGFPAPSLPGLEFASPGRRSEPRGLLYQRLLDWGGDRFEEGMPPR